MLKKLLILSYATLLVCGLAITGVAQITAVTVNNTSGVPTSDFCTGASIRVAFTSALTTFTVQLSNSAGSFASPTNIGTGTSSPVSATLPNITGNGFKVRVISGMVTSAASAQTLQIGNPPSNPTVPSTTVNYCVGATASQLSATGSNLKWYTVASGGTGNTTAPTPNTGSAGTQFYYVSQTVNGCESNRTQITVNVIFTAPPTVAQSTLNYCQGDSPGPLSANGSNLKWYTTSSGGTGNTTAPTPNTGGAGTQLYYVSQTVNGCESNRTTITVNINQRAATAPATNTNVVYCQGQSGSALSATPTSGNTIRWYASNNSTQLGGAPTPNTNVNSTTVTEYYVTQATSFGCEFVPRTKVTVTVNYTAPPSISVGLPINECQNRTATSLGNYVNASGGNSLLWYGTLSSGGSSSTTATVPSTSSTGQTTYYVTQKNNTTGCESIPRTGVIVQVNAVPNAPSVTSPVNLCLNAGAGPLSATASGGANLLWWGTNASGGSSSPSAPTPSTGSVGTTTYYVSQISNTCESSRAPISVVINAIPAAPSVATNTVLYCKDASATPLAATASSGNTLRWYNGATFIGTTAPTPSTNVGSTAVTTYNVSQISGSPANCESPKVQITTTVYVTPTPGVSSPVSYCQNAPAVALTANTGSGATVNWYTAASGGSASGTAPTPSTSTVNTTNFYVSQTLYAVSGFAGCESPRAQIAVITNPLPLAPTATNPVYCQTYGASPLTATGNSLKWYTVATGGTATTTAPTPNTANAGAINYYVSQTNGFNCEGPRAQITVTINPTPSRPSVTSVQYCQNATAVALNATPDGNNTLKWYGTSESGGTSTTTAPTPSTTSPGQTSFYVSQTNSFNCESPRGRLVISVVPTPGNPSANSPTYCATAIAQQLSANGDNLRWYDRLSGGTGSGLAPTPSTNNSTDSSTFTSYFVTQTNSFGCESPRTEVKVTVKPLPPFPNVSKQEYILCQFDPSVQLDAKLQGTGQNLVWILPNSNETGNAPVITTEAGFVGTFAVLQVRDGCRGGRTEIKVNVRTTPLPTVSTIPVVSCQNSTPQPLQATGERLKWYNTNKTGGNPQDTPNIPPTQTPGTYQFYVTQTGSNGCESPRAEITVVIQPLPSATLTGGGSITQGEPSNLTIAFTGQGPWTYTLSNGSTFTTPQNPVTIQVYPLESTIYNVTKITNNCGEGTPAGSASVQVKIATIDVGNPSATTICASQTFTIPYFSSDFFPSSTQFRVQISKTMDDASFQTIPTEGNNSPVRATIPNATSGGTYYLRIVGLASVAGNNFTIKGKLSPVQINVRELPTATISGPTRIYENESAKLAIAFTGETPWNITYRDSLSTKDTTFSTSATPYEFTVRPGKTNTYSVVSISNGCGNGPATSRFVLIVDPVLGVEPALSSEWIKVYPVPVQARCTIEIDGTTGKTVSMTVTDGLGRIILRQQTTSNKDELDFSSLAPGMYFLNAERDGQMARRKILKIQ